MSAVVLAAGGTGGHVFPAAALAEALLARGRRLALITDARGDSYRTAAFGVAAIESHPIRSATLVPAKPLATIKGLYDVVAGTLASRGLLKRLKACMVVGFGGYPSLPPMLAALATGLPTIIHEQNAVLGRVNRMLAPHVTRLALSLGGTRRLGRRAAARSTTTGNPVREAIRAVREIPYRAPEAGGRVRLLVLGGSQGAAIFSAIVPQALSQLAIDVRTRLAVVQQCRPEDVTRVGGLYEGAAIAADLAPFMADLPDRLAEAHLVVARAGASTVAELAVAGRPAVLVPIATATDAHQAGNAASLVDAGGAWLMTEAEFTADALKAHVERVIAAPDLLAAAAAAARTAGRPDAAERLADLVERLLAGAGETAP